MRITQGLPGADGSASDGRAGGVARGERAGAAVACAGRYRPDTLVDMATLAQRDLTKAGKHELEFTGVLRIFRYRCAGRGSIRGWW